MNFLDGMAVAHRLGAVVADLAEKHADELERRVRDLRQLWQPATRMIVEQAIRYNVRRSSFYQRIDDEIRAAKNAARAVRVELEPGGYTRDVRITIRKDDPHAFRSDWKYAEKRFSARLRAAATVLRDRGAWGAYHAVHIDGLLTLERL